MALTATPKRQTKGQRYDMFYQLLRQLSPQWTEEYRFHPERKWRMDFARPDIRLAIEVDGGVWTGGRHSGGAGQVADMEKGNAAVMLGWQTLHFTPQQVKNGEAYRFVHFLHHRKVTQEHAPTDRGSRSGALERKTL